MEIIHKVQSISHVHHTKYNSATPSRRVGYTSWACISFGRVPKSKATTPRSRFLRLNRFCFVQSQLWMSWEYDCDSHIIRCSIRLCSSSLQYFRPTTAVDTSWAKTPPSTSIHSSWANSSSPTRYLQESVHELPTAEHL